MLPPITQHCIFLQFHAKGPQCLMRNFAVVRNCNVRHRRFWKQRKDPAFAACRRKLSVLQELVDELADPGEQSRILIEVLRKGCLECRVRCRSLGKGSRPHEKDCGDCCRTHNEIRPSSRVRLRVSQSVLLLVWKKREAVVSCSPP